MSENIIYFITGANKGIGHALTRTLLLRPRSTIIATTRSSSPPLTLTDLPKHPTSTLIPLPLTFKPSSLAALPALLTQHGIPKIHILILNAGQATSFRSVAETSLDEMREHFEVNTLWPVALWQVLRPFFFPRSEQMGTETKDIVGNEGTGEIDEREVRKVIYISSSLGSIAGMESGVPSLAYGVSKAGGDYFVRKVHFEEEGVVSFALHPGWVKTDNGQAFADSVGISEPPMT
ncbi:toxin biosynthesis ketoreductase protein [Rutstroemia sp. NJR-2017a BBW]|nr:toxin biosynthesis ketoreductase protein [Rutstroemia sp. NJR-2017a BBW]